MKRTPYFMYVMLLAAVVVSCSKSNEEEINNGDNGGNNGNTCDTANIKFVANIKPILQNNCYACHSNVNSGTSGGVKLEDYADVKAHADNGNLIGTITHAAGYPPMPQGGSKLSDCNINKIKAWIGRGSQNN